MTKADIYKAVSDLIFNADDVSVDYILGINDMARHLAEIWIESRPEPAPKKSQKTNLDMGKVKALRDAGRTLKEIGDEMGVAPSTISNKLKEDDNE